MGRKMTTDVAVEAINAPAISPAPCAAANRGLASVPR